MDPSESLTHLERVISASVLAFLGWQFKRNRGSGEKRDTRVDRVSDAVEGVKSEVKELKDVIEKLKSVIGRVGERIGDKMEAVKHDLHSVEMRVVKLEALLIERKEPYDP